jgi:hypothetical protein
MIDSISSQYSVNISATYNSSSSSKGLSSSQLETISSTLSQFDSSSLSEDDAKSIVETFSAAGIEGSKELASAMEEAGFDAKEVGDLAGLGGPQGGGGGMPPPPPSEEEFDSVSSLLDTLFNYEDDEDISSTASFDEVLDYTSRILSLNEDSKSSVMDLLSTYSNEETNDYSQEEQASLLKSSLSSILSDNSNYKNVSFYA